MGEEFKIKGKQDSHVCHLKAKDTEDGKPKDVRIPVKYVGFWSRKYEGCTRHDKEKLIERARSLIKCPSAFSAHEAHGASNGAYLRKHYPRLCVGRYLVFYCCTSNGNSRN